MSKAFFQFIRHMCFLNRKDSNTMFRHESIYFEPLLLSDPVYVGRSPAYIEGHDFE